MRSWRICSPRPVCSSLGVTYPMAGVEADGVVVAAARRSSVLRAAGSRIVSSWGFSALTCPKRLSIQAWSVGVRGRRGAGRQRARRRTRGWLSMSSGGRCLSRPAGSVGRVLFEEFDSFGGDELCEALGGQGAVEDDPDLGGGLLDRYQRVDPAAADDVDDRERHPAGAREVGRVPAPGSCWGPTQASRATAPEAPGPASAVRAESAPERPGRGAASTQTPTPGPHRSPGERAFDGCGPPAPTVRRCRGSPRSLRV